MTNRISVRIRTRMSYGELETVLKKHCRRPVQMLFEGLQGDAAHARKVMTLVFENEGDRDTLKAALSGAKA